MLYCPQSTERNEMTTTPHTGIIYDSELGHVCGCSEREPHRDADGNPIYPDYDRTVSVDRSVEPTESGSWYYRCSRCGAGAWSGC